jgi:ribulose-phosphate 3-epimerase
MAIPERARREVHLLPSILSADFSRLGEQVREVMDAGASIIHVDVMDGHFVPNITVGPLVVQALAAEVHGRGGYFSVHLMIEHPEDYLGAFVQAGGDAVTVHAEACTHVYHALEAIRALGASPGVALNPGSDVSRLKDLVGLVDHVLVMTVNPGFGGQSLIGPALEKLPELRRMLPDGVAIEVDGGVNRENIRQVVQMGGNWVIAGSAVFGAAGPGAEVRALQSVMVGEGGL